MCRLCRTHVLERSKHCGVCNRCVDQFDHHCDWLNNCIGKKNYWLFIALIIIVGFFSLLQLACNVAIMVTINQEDYKSQLMDFYDISSTQVYLLVFITLGICCVLEIMFLLFILQLIFLHYWLSKHDVTTYEYVMYKREHPNENIDLSKIRRSHKSKVITKVKPKAVPIKGNEEPSTSERTSAAFGVEGPLKSNSERLYTAL
eukprot:TRINITY_DN2435_c0_g1_i4.p1 TRINITY_DN2435_c0_g1~~TRINITY_DN2435_c0_g1_i4.p1  ORF type:complete len:202 (-),score=23.10 TRINITY_DN2435_c0_g1_i4:921-1526(-)